MTTEKLLDPDSIRDGVAHALVGHKILVFRETASTNDVVHRLAAAGEPEGTAVFAESQSAGRGQFGREWDSRAGLGLWFSVLLRPQWPAHQIDQITPMVSVSVADTVIAFAGVEVAIKPPNDIYFGGRKLGGILTEARTGTDCYAVVGIGLNVNHCAGDFPQSLATRATSLAQIVGWKLDREILAVQLLNNLGSIYSPIAAPTAEVLNRYEDLSRRWECATLRT